MDISSLIGIISGFGFVIATILLGSGLGLFVNIPSVLVVVGGTIAATMIANPLANILTLGSVMARIFKFKLERQEDLITLLVDISNKARKGGLLSIEGEIKDIKDPFLAKALQMTVDGVQSSSIAAIMQKQMALVKKQHKTGSNMFSSMGAYAPAFGMVGTLIGLVQMLASLDDPSTIGPKMAVAMITTFYGAILANLLFIPMADKLKLRSEEEITNMTLLFEGVMSIREGEHPRLLEDKLNVYLSGGTKSKGQPNEKEK